MQRLFLLLLSGGLFFPPFIVRAQEITGIWEGHFVSEHQGRQSSNVDDRYKFEVQIAQRGKTLEAVTYSYLSTIFYGKAAASGAINVHTGKVLLQEGKLLELRNNFPGNVCIMTCFFQYYKYGGEEFLEGKYVSMSLPDSSNCGKGTVLLRKKISSDFYEEPFLVEREKELEKEAAAPTPDSTALAARRHKPLTKPAPTHRPDSTAVAARSPQTGRPPSCRSQVSTAPGQGLHAGTDGVAARERQHDQPEPQIPHRHSPGAARPVHYPGPLTDRAYQRSGTEYL
jgi:hypothetical protein